MSRVAKIINVTNNDIKKLNSIIGNEENSNEVKNRCKAILLAAKGKQNKEIAEELGVRRNSVGDWRNAWINNGIEGILSIARSGRPKSPERISIESQIKEATSIPDQETVARLAAQTNISKSTLSRALSLAGNQFSVDDLIAMRLATEPKMLDIHGLYISSCEAAIILRTAPINQKLSGGTLLSHNKCVHDLLEAEIRGPYNNTNEYTDENINVTNVSIELGEALDILSQNASKLDYHGPTQSLRKFLSSLIPYIPVKENEQYYVIYYSARPMNNIHVYSSVHYTVTSNMDHWNKEVHFWINTLHQEADYADAFLKKLKAYTETRLVNAEAFQWCRSDIVVEVSTDILADSSVFDDANIKNVMIGTLKVYDRCGEMVDVTITDYNVIPGADDIRFDNIVTASKNVGDIDSGVTRFMKKLGAKTIKEYMESVEKKRHRKDKTL